MTNGGDKWMVRATKLVLILELVFLFCGRAPAQSPEAKRGKEALLSRPLLPPAWSLAAFQNLWKRCGLAERPTPDVFNKLLREHYGLRPASFPNDDLPMGLQKTKGLLLTGITTNCLLCHGGSLLGQTYVGLPNAALDIQALFEDLAAADGRPSTLPFTFSHVRGTTEAGAMAEFLLGWREPDLRLRTSRLDLGLHDEICLDAPAWWLFKKKKTMYFTGGLDARSVRALMQFMMSPLSTPARFAAEEKTFVDIRAYLLTLEPPKYPFAINGDLAAQGEKLFRSNCTRCHGTYGEHWTYPNKIIPIDDIGTDPQRFVGIADTFVRYYNQSWFGKAKPGWLIDEMQARVTVGYQAPPLDGIWATAPYFHNGAIPTVYHVLNSSARPARFTRSYDTDRAAYDARLLGWKYEDTGRPPSGPRRVYDTTEPGRSNHGHTYGDHLSEAERMAVVEYLKTL
jgi:mono/diheme cytochrome c family protein